MSVPHFHHLDFRETPPCSRSELPQFLLDSLDYFLQLPLKTFFDDFFPPTFMWRLLFLALNELQSSSFRHFCHEINFSIFLFTISSLRRFCSPCFLVVDTLYFSLIRIVCCFLESLSSSARRIISILLLLAQCIFLLPAPLFGNR